MARYGMAFYAYEGDQRNMFFLTEAPQVTDLADNLPQAERMFKDAVLKEGSENSWADLYRMDRDGYHDEPSFRLTITARGKVNRASF